MPVVLLVIICIIALAIYDSRKFNSQNSVVTKISALPVEGSDCDVVERLEEVSSFGIGAGFADSDSMLKTIHEAEPIIEEKPTTKGCYWLGIAYRNYCAWFIRGDNRKQYLEKSVKYLEIAFELSKKDLPLTSNNDFEWLSQVVIAGELCQLFIDNAVTRNLEKGLVYAQFVFDSVDGYDPALLSLSDYYYKIKDFEKSVEVAREIKRRINTDKEWRGIINVNSNIIAPLRALRNKYKKEGDYETALKWSRQIVRFTKDCSETDKKRHEVLLSLTKH